MKYFPKAIQPTSARSLRLKVRVTSVTFKLGLMTLKVRTTWLHIVNAWEKPCNFCKPPSFLHFFLLSFLCPRWPNFIPSAVYSLWQCPGPAGGRWACKEEETQELKVWEQKPVLSAGSLRSTESQGRRMGPQCILLSTPMQKVLSMFHRGVKLKVLGLTSSLLILL